MRGLFVKIRCATRKCLQSRDREGAGDIGRMEQNENWRATRLLSRAALNTAAGKLVPLAHGKSGLGGSTGSRRGQSGNGSLTDGKHPLSCNTCYQADSSRSIIASTQPHCCGNRVRLLRREDGLP